MRVGELRGDAMRLTRFGLRSRGANEHLSKAGMRIFHPEDHSFAVGRKPRGTGERLNERLWPARRRLPVETTSFAAAVIGQPGAIRAEVNVVGIPLGGRQDLGVFSLRALAPDAKPPAFPVRSV